MNVIVANKQHSSLMNSLDIDIIKSLSGEYESSEIVDMFKSFFYSRMILDVTALKNNDSLDSYSTLIKGLDINKIIFLLPAGSSLCTPSFLSKLIDIGIYNFTTNIDGVKYLYNKPNTLKDVEHIKDIAKKKEQELAKKIEEAKLAAIKAAEAAENSSSVEEAISTSEETDKNDTISKSSNSLSRSTIIGVKNVTEHAGATTLSYIIKRELASVFGSQNIVAIEVNAKDFSAFNEKNMFSTTTSSLKTTINEHADATIIILDLNDCDDSICDDVIYLIEPSIIMLNKLIRSNKDVFSELKDKKVVLNQSLLLNSDVSDFEHEAGIPIFYNMPALDERKRNGIVNDFLSKLGLFNSTRDEGSSNKIFGLFRR
jgi:predicted RNA-binding protein with EMAP domain